MATRSRPVRWPEAAARDLAACRELLAHGSRTFLAASMLLPRRVRLPACALYAFCRVADDEVDGQGEAAGAGDGGAPAVARLRERLERLYAGQPHDHPADRALAAVVREYGIPSTLLEALIDGFAWDAEERRYETLDELHGYAARVAGTVGAMMALLMGVRHAAALARACDLGVAMQLSNIARDVGEDARNGRIYLPLQWLREEGLDPEAWLAAPRHDAALGRVVQRLLREADALYERAGCGVALLPMNCRPGINAARFLYAQIGLEVERRGLDAIAGRAVVGRHRKAWGLLCAAVALAPDDAAAALPPLPATRYLVEAVTGPLNDAKLAPRPQGVAWVLELFERLEKRDRGLLVAE